ncbi:MAG: hypothetical protein ABJF88_15285 [Rhodothermales bacterium]
MKKQYVISSDLDYSQSISPAAGPVYAERMGWPVLSFDEAFGSEFEILCSEGWTVVDNRLSERECEILTASIEANPEMPFVLKAIDPYYEWCRDHWYYRMLFAVARRPNVYFLSPYVPAEVVADLDRASGGDRLVVVPYAYPADVEQPAGGGRKQQVIFSGNQLRTVYPFRYQFDRIATWWPPLGRHVDVLEHPGYPDIGEEQKHEQIGARYIEHLARYAFMFVSPSRCRLEFLKYGECAAAGCVPIGVLPRGFPADATEAFVQLDFDNVFRLERSTRRAIQTPADEIEARARAYRDAMRSRRSASVLNEQLDAFLASASAA